MLKLIDIKKDYLMKDSKVSALKGITVNFRKNEFVSILGPSGCGKTTLLNILGGLDQYTSGDLIIDGKSTKDFKDHDWDIYRNHRIGFIFQSYNLIPQENIEENVELALTIAGIGKEERVKRAREALDRVGLKDMYKKKPNQLSGGQCQRVAIARALVNEPEILLADEPTGALDSVTSVQIMDLIKEISKDKLVIMVTHNPELAKQYSTRIVELLDGNLIKDSNPYSSQDEDQERLNQEKTKIDEKAKMSWWTAFRLSSKNLLSKMKRTSMVVIAASIGIIGVSAVLSVSYGVNGYIESIQDEMLSGNPIAVAKSSFDLSSITSSMTQSQQTAIVKEATKDGYIDVDFITERLVKSARQMGTSMIQNNITQEYVDFISSIPEEYYKDIVLRYGIDVTNNLYTTDTINGYDSNTTFSLSGITSIATAVLEKKLAENGYSSYASMISSYSGTFAQSMNSKDYILEQYDVVNGKVAENADELMIVASDDKEVSDLTLTLLGYYSQDQFMEVVDKYNTDDGTPKDTKVKDSFTYEELMNKKFVYYPNNAAFEENDSGSKSEKKSRPYYYNYIETDSMKALESVDVSKLNEVRAKEEKKNTLSDQEKEDLLKEEQEVYDPNKKMELKIVGILKPKSGRQYSSLSTGFYYTPAFSQYFIKQNIQSKIVSWLNDYLSANPDLTGYSSSYLPTYSQEPQGIYYTFHYQTDDTGSTDKYALVGQSSSMSSILSLLGGSSGTSANVATLTLSGIGGNSIPTSIRFYPNSFKDKYLVTDYLDQWNSSADLVVNGKTIKKSDREDIKYTDNLAVVISMISMIIQVVTISLIAFTALSLVVSTVMIAIITYVSVMERIKEIGTIRALGGRKKDVSHLFNAETLLIGLASGVFGIIITYVIQFFLNLGIHLAFPQISRIASLPPLAALIIILVSILLTVVAGLIPASSAARKDPVVALRTE